MAAGGLAGDVDGCRDRRARHEGVSVRDQQPRLWSAWPQMPQPEAGAAAPARNRTGTPPYPVHPLHPPPPPTPRRSAISASGAGDGWAAWGGGGWAGGAVGVGAGLAGWAGLAAAGRGVPPITGGKPGLRRRVMGRRRCAGAGRGCERAGERRAGGRPADPRQRQPPRPARSRAGHGVGVERQGATLFLATSCWEWRCGGGGRRK